jgi:hypothetical protein
MEKRHWTSQQKLTIVLEGLSGSIEISKLCAKYQIAQTQYYQWRDQLLKYGKAAFETKDVTKKEQKNCFIFSWASQNFHFCNVARAILQTPNQTTWKR